MWCASGIGLTVLELLVVLAVIAILAAIAAPRFPSRAAQVYANDVRAVILQGRYEAVKRNRPIAVVWNATELEWQTLLGPPEAPCNAGPVLLRANMTQYPRVTLEPRFAPATPPAVGNGVVWLPNGQARACDLGLLAEETIAIISDSSVTRQVVVSIAGRVSVK